MEFERVYNNCIYKELIGYKFNGGFITKETHLSYHGNKITDGWSVEEHYLGKRLFYAGTLKEAKDWISKNF